VKTTRKMRVPQSNCTTTSVFTENVKAAQELLGEMGFSWRKFGLHRGPAVIHLNETVTNRRARKKVQV
jgi:hypothetical protein